jgi:thioredoxin 1
LVQERMVRDVSPDEVDAEMKKTKLLFVDCWAPWCNPCLALAPILDELDQKYADNEDVGFLKVNTQIHVQFAMDNNITGIPCVLIFVDGGPAKIQIETEGAAEPHILDRLVGLRPAEHYQFIIDKVMGTETD